MQNNPESEKQNSKEVSERIAYIRKSWATMARDQLIEVMTESKESSDELIRNVSVMNDQQLQIVYPLMSHEQVKRTIPLLQLQQQGVAVLSLSPEKIKSAISAMIKSDKLLLIQNISLFINSETNLAENEDLQSIIGFIDPLAIAASIEIESLSDKVLEACSIMTKDQVRVIMPLLTTQQIKKAIEYIESEDTLKDIPSMITSNQKKSALKEMKKEYQMIKNNYENGVRHLLGLKEKEKEKKKKKSKKKTSESSDTKISKSFGAKNPVKLPEDLIVGFPLNAFIVDFHLIIEKWVDVIESKLKPFSKDDMVMKESDYQEISSQINKLKRVIEGTQKISRSSQKKLKVPLTIIKEKNFLNKFKKLAAQITENTGHVHLHSQRIDKGNLKDGLVHVLNEKWKFFKNQQVADEESQVASSRRSLVSSLNDITVLKPQDNDFVFVDDDASVELYEAIKSIGNPTAIGDIYKITWNEIISNGFRSQEDLKRAGIDTLKALEEYILKENKPVEKEEAVKG